MGIRKVSAASAAALLGLVAGPIAATTPAQAAGCYNRGGYSFTLTSDRLSSEIEVWRGSGCNGNPIGRGTAALVNGSGRIQLTAWDLNCDNTGMWAYVHGYSTHPGGCGETTHVRFNLSDVGSPRNWWLNVGGSSGVNSNAVNLPS
jgi:hypothetical protein